MFGFIINPFVPSDGIIIFILFSDCQSQQDLFFSFLMICLFLFFFLEIVKLCMIFCDLNGTATGDAWIKRMKKYWYNWGKATGELDTNILLYGYNSWHQQHLTCWCPNPYLPSLFSQEILTYLKMFVTSPLSITWVIIEIFTLFFL